MIEAAPPLPLTVSVVICTYNRCVSLAQTLDSLAAMEVPNDVRLSIQVVDNNSSDQTADVVRRYSDRLPLHYCFEPKQGLSNARNRGIQESEGELIIFTDDDVRVTARWLSAYAAAVVRFPEALYFGGRIKPYWAKGKPRWLIDDRLDLIDGLFVHYDQGDCSRYYDKGDPRPIGASMAFRRTVFKEVGEFCPSLGVRAGDMGRGEETEFIGRLVRLGYRGGYVAEALCLHEVDPRRTTLRYAFQYGIASGISWARICATGATVRGSYVHAGWFCLLGIRQQLFGRGDRFRQCLINAGIQLGARAESSRLAREPACVCESRQEHSADEF